MADARERYKITPVVAEEAAATPGRVPAAWNPKSVKTRPAQAS